MFHVNVTPATKVANFNEAEINAMLADDDVEMEKVALFSAW